MKTVFLGVEIQFLGKHDSTDVQNVARVHQVHGNRTVVVREPSGSIIPKADGMITDVPGLSLLIRAADCQNFAIIAPKSRVLGALHVGWRGLLAGATFEYFRVLKANFGIDARDTYVFAGPSLCKQCAEFTDPTAELPGIDPKYFTRSHVDLPQIATDQMFEAGVLPEQLKRQADCTCCNSQTYWTYRGGDRDAVSGGKSNMLVCYLT